MKVFKTVLSTLILLTVLSGTLAYLGPVSFQNGSGGQIPGTFEESSPVPDTGGTAPADGTGELSGSGTYGQDTDAPDTDPGTLSPDTSGTGTETSAPDTETSAPDTETEPPDTGTEAPDTETSEPLTEAATAEETAAPAPSDIKVSSITIKASSSVLTAGGSLPLSVTVKPSGATDKRVVWSVDCPETVATITSSGLLSGTGAGTVTVTATARDGSGVSASKVFTVKDPVNVGITCASSSLMNNAASKITQAGAVPVELEHVRTREEAASVIAALDAIVFSGGEDIDPAYYGEAVLNSTVNINARRDLSDILLMQEALKAGIPMLCICRGMQLLNVVCGGTLYQDIPSQISGAIKHKGSSYVLHPVSVDSGSLLNKITGKKTLSVYSYHHQSVKDTGAGLRVTATSRDGIVEAIEFEDMPYVAAVQFHPEKDSALLCMFEWLVAQGSEFGEAGHEREVSIQLPDIFAVASGLPPVTDEPETSDPEPVTGQPPQTEEPSGEETAEDTGDQTSPAQPEEPGETADAQITGPAGEDITQPGAAD